METIAITIEIDQYGLQQYTDEYLAACWHIAQANPADGFKTTTPGDLVERIGREIIRRWLGTVPPELWRHQGRHHYWGALMKIAKYQPGGEPGTPEWKEGEWVPKASDETDEPRNRFNTTDIEDFNATDLEDE